MTYRTTFAVFMLEQGDTFNRDDTVFVANTLTDQESDAYLDAIAPLTSQPSRYTEGSFCSQGNIVEESPIFAKLTDHPRHVGYTYDIFGDILKSHQNPIFISLQGDTDYNICHTDGVCALHYNQDDGGYHDRVKLGWHEELTFAENRPLTTESETEDRSSLMPL